MYCNVPPIHQYTHQSHHTGVLQCIVFTTQVYCNVHTPHPSHVRRFMHQRSFCECLSVSVIEQLNETVVYLFAPPQSRTVLCIVGPHSTQQQPPSHGAKSQQVNTNTFRNAPATTVANQQTRLRQKIAQLPLLTSLYITIR